MPPVTSHLVAPAGALVGRENEISLLSGLLRELVRGRGGTVLIEGEPGIGKSTLVRTALDRAALRRNSMTQTLDADFQEFWCVGDELGQEIPLLPFLDGLRVREASASQRRAAIAGLLRGETATDRGADVPGALAEQLLALVADECAARPTVLVVDDLQWVDPASVKLWGRLARLAGQVPLLLAGIMRPVPQRDDLLALRRSAASAKRIPLTALSKPAVADLVANLAGAKPDETLLRLADGAAGNPFYLTELMAALDRSGGLAVSDAGTAALADDAALNSLPGSLSGVIADRLGFVSGPVLKMLRAAALLGVDFTIRDLEIVLGRSVTDLLSAVDESRAAGVLTDSGGRLGFRHPLIRAALYDGMTADVRAAWHREAGRALAKAGAQADRVARQLLWAIGAPGGGATGPIASVPLNGSAKTADVRGNGSTVPGSRGTRPVGARPGNTVRWNGTPVTTGSPSAELAGPSSSNSAPNGSKSDMWTRSAKSTDAEPANGWSASHGSADAGPVAAPSVSAGPNAAEPGSPATTEAKLMDIGPSDSRSTDIPLLDAESLDAWPMGVETACIGPIDASPLLDVPMDQWMLDWLDGTADLIVSQAPGVAADLLSRAVANTPVGSPRYGWLASRLADALYRTGDTVRAGEVANRALEHAADPDPDVIVDLHWTLTQCRGLAGASAESLTTLNRTLTLPGLSAKHRARLLVLAARTRFTLGEVDTTGQVASDALAAASEVGDTWAMSWALHVLTIVATVRGQPTDALSLYDRALAVTQADPALTDLRLLLQVNMAATLANLDRYTEALAVAEQARHLAGQVGTAVRLAHAHCTLGELLYETGRWDDALAEIAAVPDDLKEPARACDELGIAAVIAFHRGETDAARKHLTAAIPHAERIGHRLLPPLALAQSTDHEQDGALPEALAALTVWFGENMEEAGQAEDLVADAVRLAVLTGDLATAKTLTDQAAGLAAESEIPHRQANALYCRGLVEHDAQLLLAAAARYEDASRPLPTAKALEAAAMEFVEGDDRTRAREAMERAIEVYTSLGAAADVSRLQAAFRAQGIRRGPRSKHRKATSGWDSLTDMELKIAACVQEGMTNPQIAAKLVMSPRTVGTHVAHILKKLDLRSRSEIAREAALRTLAGSRG